MLINKLLRRFFALLSPGIVGEGGGAPNPEPNAEGQEGAGAQTGAGAEGEGTPPGGAAAGGEGEQEVQVVLLGDDELPAAEEAKPWVRELRRKFKEQSQRLAAYERGSAPAEPAGALPPAPGAKPKMGDPEIDFDADKFAAALDKWHEATRKRAEAESKVRDQQAQEQRAWEQRVATYNEAGKKLGFTDFEDCEAAATAELSLTQQAIVVQGAESEEKAALIMYALGRNMSLTRELAKIADPIKFAFAIADLQRKITMTKRKPGTKPESTLPASGASASAALSGDAKKLDELREEAAKTGDMTKLLNYQREQRAKARKAA